MGQTADEHDTNLITGRSSRRCLPTQPSARVFPASDLSMPPSLSHEMNGMALVRQHVRRTGRKDQLLQQTTVGSRGSAGWSQRPEDECVLRKAAEKIETDISVIKHDEDSLRFLLLNHTLNKDQATKKEGKKKTYIQNTESRKRRKKYKESRI